MIKPHRTRKRHSIAKAEKAQERSHTASFRHHQEIPKQLGPWRHGDKNAKHISFLTKELHPSTSIPIVTTADGTNVTDPLKICAQFADYYSQLYTSQLNKTVVDIKQHILSVTNPTLDIGQQLELDADFTLEEIEDEIASFPASKAPGPDGLPSEWCKTHIKLLAPKLLDLFHLASQTNSLPHSFYQATITLINRIRTPHSAAPIGPSHC